MTPLRSKRIWMLLLAYLASGHVACAEPDPVLTKTQVTVRLRAPSDSLEAAITELRVRVYRPAKGAWSMASQASIGASRLRWPVDVPVLPASPDESAAAFEVVVEAYAGAARLTQARAVSGFAANALRLLELSLYECADASAGACALESCHGAGCNTCAVSGRCEPVSVLNASALAAYDPKRAPQEPVESEPVDAGAPLDAAPVMDTAVPIDAPVSALPDVPVIALPDAAISAPACPDSCPPARPMCEPNTQTCVECTADPHCPSDKRFCVDHRCVECRDVSDCSRPTNQCMRGFCSVACMVGSSTTMTCDKGSLVERDGCGQTVAVRSGCCGRGCSGTACNPPDPRASMGCYMGNLRYIDSCGEAGELIKDCQGHGCTKGTCNQPSAP